MLTVLLVAALPTQLWAYRILMIPLFGKSHVFRMLGIAEGLVNRGHHVTLFIGENFPVNLLELRNRSDISVSAYRDTKGGVYMDYRTMDEYCSNLAIESGHGAIHVMASIMIKVCVNFICIMTVTELHFQRIFEKLLYEDFSQ